MNFANNRAAKLQTESQSPSTGNSGTASATDGMGKITVYINSETVFFNILRSALNKVNIEVQELVFPKGKTDLLRFSWKLGRSDTSIVHILWGYHHPMIYITSILLGKRVIVHWIGTDVLSATSPKVLAPISLLRRFVYRVVSLHLTVSENLANELKSIGIKARVVPLIPNMTVSPEDTSWPSENVVLVYLPKGREEFYGSNIVFRLAEEAPNLKFLILGNLGEGMPQLSNIEFLGQVDNLASIWKRVKVYLRLTKHDGLPHMVIEALARGKQVIWSYEYPFCHKARTFEEAKGALKDIIDQNQPNTQAIAWARSTFDPLKLAQAYRNIYLELLH